jgi:hypothetical protein
MGGYQLMVSADILRGRYRESFETAKAIEADKPLPYRFALPTANHVFLPGHRDHGAGAVELVPALRPQPADLRPEHLLGEALKPDYFAAHPTDGARPRSANLPRARPTACFVELSGLAGARVAARGVRPEAARVILRARAPLKQQALL